MRIFITGVNSFVGKSLIKKLSKFKNIKIYGCDLKNINKKYHRIDISKKDFYKKIPKKNNNNWLCKIYIQFKKKSWNVFKRKSWNL